MLFFVYDIEINDLWKFSFIHEFSKFVNKKIASFSIHQKIIHNVERIDVCLHVMQKNYVENFFCESVFNWFKIVYFSLFFVHMFKSCYFQINIIFNLFKNYNEKINIKQKRIDWIHKIKKTKNDIHKQQFRWWNETETIIAKSIVFDWKFRWKNIYKSNAKSTNRDRNKCSWLNKRIHWLFRKKQNLSFVFNTKNNDENFDVDDRNLF